MNTPFSAEELNLMNDITQIALNNGVKAFAKMIKDEVLVKNLEVITAPTSVHYPAMANQQQNSLFVLGTEVVGDIGAHTYLVMNHENEAKICDVLLPSSLIPQEEMREGILLEVDNILVASLVTKYANLLAVEMHGHVPTYQKFAIPGFEALLNNHVASSEVYYAFKVDIVSFKSRIKLELFCFFDVAILTALRNFKLENSHVFSEDITAAKKGVQSFLKKLFG